MGEIPRLHHIVKLGCRRRCVHLRTGRRIGVTAGEGSDADCAESRPAAFVEFQEGAAILHAPVGTGKMLCLAERAARAIQGGTAASRIVCVTFTNLAAAQMRSQVTARR